MKKFLAVIAAIMVCSAVYMKVQLDRNCTGYLKRAADANSIEIAKGQLNIAIQYLVDNELTSGYTSVWYRTPDEDLGFWYRNLKSCQADLSIGSKPISQNDEKLILIKLRETLMDNGSSGDELTYPKGLAFYPNNALWGIARIFGVGMLFYFFFDWKTKGAYNETLNLRNYIQSRRRNREI